MRAFTQVVALLIVVGSMSTHNIATMAFGTVMYLLASSTRES